MTLIEKYKDNEKMFKLICDNYANCYCIDDLEGKLVHGEYCGHVFTNYDENNRRYFVGDGIRGFEVGWFLIKNGNPIVHVQPSTEDQLYHIFKLIELYNTEKGNITTVKEIIDKYGTFAFKDLKYYVNEHWNLTDDEIEHKSREILNNNKD